jgi:hypothetical protein
MGFGLMIEFTGIIKLVTTNDYSITANSTALQFTTPQIPQFVLHSAAVLDGWQVSLPHSV